jgi:membrane-bound lytic murein transglycosylase D
VHLLHYRVVRGDTLEGIAERFDVSVSELKRWNNIRGAKVPRGSRLRIYAGGAPDSSAHSKSKAVQLQSHDARVQDVSDSNSTDKSGPRRHLVKQGETLYSIAHAYKTTVESLRDANPFLGERPLEAGDILTIQR